MGSSIRYQRRKSGLTQREVAEILGTVGHRQVSRHESVDALPSFLVAVGYQIIFQATTEKLFPGAYETVRQGVEDRLLELERRLREDTPKGQALAVVAHKLQWLAARRSQEIGSSTDADEE